MFDDKYIGWVIVITIFGALGLILFDIYNSYTYYSGCVKIGNNFKEVISKCGKPYDVQRIESIYGIKTIYFYRAKGNMWNNVNFQNGKVDIIYESIVVEK
jgi:hypothetical protein